MISFNQRADNLIVKIRLFLEFRNTSRNEEIECINETWGENDELASYRDNNVNIMV